MLVRQYFFKPLCLLFSNSLVRQVWVVADDELFAAAVAPEYSHLLEACRLLWAVLFYCHRLHVLILDGWAIVLAGSRAGIRFVSGHSW